MLRGLTNFSARAVIAPKISVVAISRAQFVRFASTDGTAASAASASRTTAAGSKGVTGSSGPSGPLGGPSPALELPPHLRQPVTVDRPLPDVLGPRRKQRMYLAIFCCAMGLSLFAMVKYEEANSPIVTSTMYALRRSDLAREIVGPNIRFKSTMPWITGSSGIAKDVVDFSYDLVGDETHATAHFRAESVPGELRYAVTDWSLTPATGEFAGKKISLVDEEYLPHVPLANNEEPGVRRNDNRK